MDVRALAIQYAIALCESQTSSPKKELLAGMAKALGTQRATGTQIRPPSPTKSRSSSFNRFELDLMAAMSGSTVGEEVGVTDAKMRVWLEAYMAQLRKQCLELLEEQSAQLSRTRTTWQKQLCSEAERSSRSGSVLGGGADSGANRVWKEFKADVMRMKTDEFKQDSLLASFFSVPWHEQEQQCQHISSVHLHFGSKAVRYAQFHGVEMHRFNVHQRGANLNKGVGGMPKYLCFKTREGQLPVSAVCLVEADKEEVPYGFSPVLTTIDGRSGNIGASRFLFICTARSPIFSLSQLSVMFPDKKEELPTGFVTVETTIKGSTGDLNAGAQGYPTYLISKPDLGMVLNPLLLMASNARQSPKLFATIQFVAMLTAGLFSFEESTVLQSLSSFQRLPSGSVNRQLVCLFTESLCEASLTFFSFANARLKQHVLLFVMWMFRQHTNFLSNMASAQLVELCFRFGTDDSEGFMVQIVDCLCRFACYPFVRGCENGRRCYSRSSASLPSTMEQVCRDIIVGIASEVAVQLSLQSKIADFQKLKPRDDDSSGLITLLSSEDESIMDRSSNSFHARRRCNLERAMVNENWNKISSIQVESNIIAYGKSEDIRTKGFATYEISTQKFGTRLQLTLKLDFDNSLILYQKRVRKFAKQQHRANLIKMIKLHNNELRLEFGKPHKMKKTFRFETEALRDKAYMEILEKFDLSKSASNLSLKTDQLQLPSHISEGGDSDIDSEDGILELEQKLHAAIRVDPALVSLDFKDLAVEHESFTIGSTEQLESDLELDVVNSQLLTVLAMCCHVSWAPHTRVDISGNGSVRNNSINRENSVNSDNSRPSVEQFLIARAPSVQSPALDFQLDIGSQLEEIDLLGAGDADFAPASTTTPSSSSNVPFSTTSRASKSGISDSANSKRARTPRRRARTAPVGRSHFKEAVVQVLVRCLYMIGKKKKQWFEDKHDGCDDLRTSCVFLQPSFTIVLRRLVCPALVQFLVRATTSAMWSAVLMGLSVLWSYFSTDLTNELGQITELLQSLLSSKDCPESLQRRLFAFLSGCVFDSHRKCLEVMVNYDLESVVSVVSTPTLFTNYLSLLRDLASNQSVQESVTSAAADHGGATRFQAVQAALLILDSTAETLQQAKEGASNDGAQIRKERLQQFLAAQKMEAAALEASGKLEQSLEIVKNFYTNAGEDSHFVITKMATFLYRNKSRFDKTALGDLLATFDDTKGLLTRNEYSELRAAYVSNLEFTNLQFDMALRLFLMEGGFRLPGEAQKIDRMLETFCFAYQKQNPSVFRSASSAFIVAFAMIMLNTDINDPRLNKASKGKKKRKPMTMQQFVSNLRGVDDGADFPQDFLESMYRNIAAEAIEMKEEDNKEEAEDEDTKSEPVLNLHPLGMSGVFRSKMEACCRDVFAQIRNQAMHFKQFQNISKPDAALVPFFFDYFLQIFRSCQGSIDFNFIEVCFVGLTSLSFMATTIRQKKEAEALASEYKDRLELLTLSRTIYSATTPNQLVASHTKNLKKFKDSIVGTELVDWLVVNNHAPDRDKAVEKMMMLRDVGLHNLTGPSHFTDSNHIYGFLPKIHHSQHQHQI